MLDHVGDVIGLAQPHPLPALAGAEVQHQLGLVARRDMDELRELLSAWRDAKRTAWRAVVGWLVRIALALLLIGIAVRLRLTDLIAR